MLHRQALISRGSISLVRSATMESHANDMVYIALDGLFITQWVWVWVWEEAGYQGMSARPPWHPHARITTTQLIQRRIPEPGCCMNPWMDGCSSSPCWTDTVFESCQLD